MEKVVFMYDFDKTLCDRDMQEYEFIPNMQLSANEFWTATSNEAKNPGNNIEKILAYMYTMMKYAKRNNIALTREYLNTCGSKVKLFQGVKDFFVRINQMANSLGFEAEHYIISSGLKEIVKGTEIAKYFKEVYACEFHYDKDGIADFPAYVVNYTMKTQFLFRISKGAFDLNDEEKLNAKIKDEDRYVRFENMIYFGDGLTDVPCMKLVRENGGTAIAIYQENNDRIARKLFEENRVDFIAPADYRENSYLDLVIRKVFAKMVALKNLNDLRDEEKVRGNR
ncbi:MAG: haloacid dehalogenase-like hydrolase [Acholeplasmatales bacterium]|nr:haloacid dehalogenase-like hydrolase [Acholeplasmatales bacterium]